VMWHRGNITQNLFFWLLTLRTTTPSPSLLRRGIATCDSGGVYSPPYQATCDSGGAYSPPYQGGVGGGW